MKLAIIGAGLVAKTYHIPAFLRCENVKITAVCDVYEPAAIAMAEPLGAKVYTDYRELLKDPEVDTVSICTRTDTHCEMASAAAEAGKNIFLEKPMAMNEKQARRIADAVEENGVVFMLGMLNRFRTESQIITERRLSGQMGEIYHADARWIRRRGIPANSWFQRKILSGGGAGLDIGVHAIDTAWYLMGCPEPVSVSGVAHRRLGNIQCKGVASWGSGSAAARPMDTEEAMTALIRFEAEKSMTVTVSWAINGPEEDFNLRLYGTKEGACLNPFVIYGEANGYRADTVPIFHRDDPWVEGFTNEIRHFCDCAAQGREPIPSARSGYTVQRIIQGIYESADQGREIIL